MTGEWRVAKTLPSERLAKIYKRTELFNTPEWSQVLCALGGTPVFVWNVRLGLTFQIPIFHHCGVRIGFLGFPVSGSSVDGLDWSEIGDLAWDILRLLRISLLRVVKSCCQEFPDSSTAVLPEANILDLQAWRPMTGRFRRNIRLAERNCSSFKIVQTGIDYESCYSLYRTTVLAHGGKVKYTRGYFSELAALGAHSNNVCFEAALGDDGITRGFTVVALHGGRAYYLHGFVDQEVRSTRLSEYLLYRQITKAQSAGCTSMTLMASPWHQPSLHKYKMKWADSSNLSITRDFVYGPLGYAARSFMRFQGRGSRFWAKN